MVQAEQETTMVVQAEQRSPKVEQKITTAEQKITTAEQMGLKTPTVVLKTTMPATCTDLSCGSITLAVTLLHSGSDPVIKEIHGERLLELGTYGPGVAAMT